MADKKRVIESYVPLSQSKLWQFQRDYFDQEGIKAWAHQVPFYVTSNPYIAKCYAKMVIAFVRDWVTQHPESISQPFYIVELGTGAGRFSYYVLKKLAELQTELGLANIQLRYIMTDFTQSNVDFWQQQPQLQPFVLNGMLDFALYNMEQEQPLRCVHSGEILQPDSVKNPLTILANYIFDTVSSDCFQVQKNKLTACLVSMTAPENDFVDDVLTTMDGIDVSHQLDDMPESYFQNEKLNQVVSSYQTKLTDTYVTIPSAGIKALDYLMRFANGKTLLLSSDKGYTTLNQLDYNQFPGIAFHGSFSIMVNMHAIGEYYKLCNGNVVMQSERKGLSSMMAVSNMSLVDLPNLRVAAADCVQGMSPADYFILHRRISDTYEECTIATLAAHLQFSDWDPHIFKKLIRRITSAVLQADRSTVEYLAQHMHRIAQNFYYMPEVHDTLFDIAFFFHTIQRYDEAIRYYNQSAQYFGKKYGLLYNLGLCHYYNKSLAESIEYFKEALNLEPNNSQAKEWLVFAEKELSQSGA